jgi:mannose-6-phosphate isomerase-like protein (cupin superfamily)
MFVRNLEECKEITALDNTTLRELINPFHDGDELKISYSIAHAIIKPGQTSLPHRLTEASEVYYLLQGEGIMHIENEKRPVGSGDLIYVPPNSTQFLENTGADDIVFLCIVDPYWRPEKEKLVEEHAAAPKKD